MKWESSFRVTQRINLLYFEKLVVEKQHGMLERGREGYVLETSSSEFGSPALYLTNLEALVKLNILSKYQFPHHWYKNNMHSEVFFKSRDNAWEAPSTEKNRYQMFGNCCCWSYGCLFIVLLAELLPVPGVPYSFSCLFLEEVCGFSEKKHF